MENKNDDENNNEDENKPKFPTENHLDEYVNPKKIKFEPKNWQAVFDFIRQMRGQNEAPVDTMGKNLF